MKPTTPRRTRRLLARAATMNHAAEEFDDYGPEPNMKLSHAFLVVLLLHVIAVGGLYAFNSMKAGKQTEKAPAKQTVAQKAPSSPKDSSGKGGSPQGGPGGGDKEPLEPKPAPVAKLNEQPSAAKVSGARHSSPTDPSPKGQLASARGMIQKAVGATASTAAVSKLAAQEPSPTQAAPAASEGGQTYVVKSGDTVTRIASSLGVPIPDLEKANGLAGNAVLQVGQVLKVPAQQIAQASSALQAEPVQTPPAPAATAPTAVPGQAATATSPAAPSTAADYTVVKGDSPYKIAKKFKITPDELMKANGITDPKKIQIGQVLKIPAPSGKGTPAK